MELKRLSVLDSLRGIAAMGVAFFWHYQHFAPKTFPFSQKAYWFYNYGYSLVDLFFVLSGFVFCYVYKNRIVNREITFKKYAILRFSRLYPLLFITLVFVGILQKIRMETVHNYFIYQYNDIYHLLLNIFCIQYGWFEKGFSFNAPSWSVSCELVAYILFYIFIYIFNESRKYTFAYIGTIFLGLFLIKTNLDYPLLNQSMASVFIGFFAGCLTYEVNEIFNLNKCKNKIMLFCVGILLAVTISTSIYGNIILGNWKIVYTILFYPLIILISLNVNIISKILSFKPIIYLGRLSFSIYLWHFPVQLVIKTLDDIFGLSVNYSSKSFFFLFIIITLVISIASYELIEKKSNRYLREKLLLHIK